MQMAWSIEICIYAVHRFMVVLRHKDGYYYGNAHSVVKNSDMKSMENIVGTSITSFRISAVQILTITVEPS